ncbi:MAG: helix-turn-helix transcriptional regulator [Nocardioidaceae bacterium]
MLDTSARLLALLSLLQTHRAWSGPELAQRLEITPRTVRRDVDRLRSLGYPVDATLGTSGGYRLGRGSAVPPLLLDDNEAVALIVTLRAAATVGLAGIDDSAIQALNKLDHVMPARLQHRARTIADAIAAPPARGPQVDPDVLATVAGAIRDNQQLRVDYVRHDGTASRRTVEASRIVHTGTRWYLLAFDLAHEDWRTLRMDRLTPRTPTGPTFTPRPLPSPDPVSYVLDRVHTRPYQYQCDVTVAAPAETVADSFGIHAADVEAIDADHCRVRAGASTIHDAALYFIALDADLAVHAPDGLRQHIQSLARRLSKTT